MNVSVTDKQSMIRDILSNKASTISKSSESSSNGRKPGELGKDDFLNLLITQLRYQDPMQPTDDKEFIGQMAQFSALEQMQNMSKGFEALKALSLMGKTITASIPKGNSTETDIVNGVVSSVKLAQGKAYVIVNDKEVSVDKITEVR